MFIFIAMNKSITFILVVLFWCAAINLRGQQLYFNHLSVNNGLSQGVNNCVYRDSKGFVWISSYDGLNRFDGVNCVNFRSSIFETGGLKGTYILNILEDKNANLWIGSNAGLNFYNRRLDRFQNFRIEDPKTDKQFYSPFYIDDKNNIWLEINSQIAVFNPDNQTFHFTDTVTRCGKLIIKAFPAQLYLPLEKIVASSGMASVIWEGEVTGEKVNWHSTHLPIPSVQITAILPTGKNNLWIGSRNGLYRLINNRLNMHIQRFGDIKLANITTMHLDQKGTLWAGTIHQGLVAVDTTAGKVKNHYENSAYNSFSLAGNQVQFINTDERGDLWVSVWGKGVDYVSINKFRFSHYLKKEQTELKGSDNFVRSIIQVNDEFWCSTQSGGILILDENKKIRQVLKKGLPMFIEHLCLDSDNQVWVATYEGLFVIDPVTRKISRLPFNNSGFSHASNEYNFICLLHNRLMMGSTNDGLFYIEKQQNRYQTRPVKGIKNSNVIFLNSFVDKQNHIYVSRSFKGFSVYQSYGDTLQLLKEFPIEASVKCFNEQVNSIIWIASTIGLIQFNKNTMEIDKVYTTKEGLSNNFIYGVISEGHNLWLSTNAGINRFNTRDKTVKTFTLEDGLQGYEYNTNSFCKTKNGEILFGGVNGLNSFLPSGFISNSYPPQLILTDIQLNNISYRPVNPAEIRDLSINYHQNTIGFEFAVIHYANAGANTISYMLEGYDKSWVRKPSRNVIRYSNLPYGHFTLKVKAFSADGIEADSIYLLPITIHPPWWLRWWFKLILVLGLIALIALFIRNYTNRRLQIQRVEHERIQSVEKERNRIGRDMHDDLGSGLTIIAILSEVVKTKLEEPEKARKLLDRIAVSSRDLVDNLQDIIWVLNPKYDTLESLAFYLREYGLKYFEHLPVVMEFKYPVQFSRIHLSEEQRRYLFLTVKETFNNIAKYACCTRVTVAIQEGTDEILLSINDDGKGFDFESVRSYANGLKNMSTRIEQVGGRYQIISAPGKGTLTEIHFSGNPFLLHVKLKS